MRDDSLTICPRTDRPIYEQNQWVTRNNGLHTILLEDSGSDLAYIGEFKDEKIARRIADDHNNRLSADASREAERSNIGGGTGAIKVDGRVVFVED